MIIPSIDLMDGQSVQLVQGKAESRSKEREYGDPIPLAEKFRLAGDIAVIDLDSALGKGSNAATIEKLLRVAPIRVGGGIRDVATARRWLDAGARKVILGTAAKPEILSQLPRDRVMASLDAWKGEVVVEGWTKKTGAQLLDKIKELREYTGHFLVTFVEREGGLGGTDMEFAKQIVEAAGKKCRVTFAGGITTAREIAELDKMDADAQVGMAIYTGKLHLADAIMAPAISDRPDGLYATVVMDECGRALGLAYSDLNSVREAVDRKMGVYHSRKRGLWIKGLTSGDSQDLVGIRLDCDRDAIGFYVKQHGRGYCHLPQFTCFGPARGLMQLEQTLGKRKENAPEGSYTGKLFNEPALLKEKLIEEAGELADAESREEVLHEAADMIYFAMAAMTRAGVSLADVERELDLRSFQLASRGRKKENEK